MKIPSYIKDLLNGETVPASRIREDLANELMEEGLLHIMPHGSKRSYRSDCPGLLYQYLIGKDESYRLLELDINKNVDTRSEQAEYTGNSKLVPARSCPGFPINSYEEIECNLKGKPFYVKPQDGCFSFITDWQKFKVPEDVVIVGVENMENFRFPKLQSYLFKEQGKVLFVSRYPQSTDLRRWLQSIPNRYIHFGDFDLAGIHIYETEFYKYLGERASFFIPEDIEIRLKNGSIDRYDFQLDKFRDYKPSDNRLTPLFDLLHKYHRGYDQEGYITF